MKFHGEYTKFDTAILIINVILTFLSGVLVVMQISGVAETYLWYMGIFSITFFLQAYISRADDARYKRNMMCGFFFTIMMLFLN